MAVIVAPITDAAVPAVSVFLHEHLNSRVPAQAWAQSMHVPWSAHAPNHGFYLLDDATVVGAYLAFYSERIVDGRVDTALERLYRRLSGTHA